MATIKDAKRTPSGKIQYRGETFSGYNKPKRTPKANKKSAVLAKVGDQIKIVRFGDQNMTIKKISQLAGKALEQDITAILQKINSLLDIGHVRRGSL